MDAMLRCDSGRVVEDTAQSDKRYYPLLQNPRASGGQKEGEEAPTNANSSPRTLEADNPKDTQLRLRFEVEV